MCETNRNQKLMIFFSADIVGSTRFKILNHCNDGKLTWPDVFLQFYKDIRNGFIESIKRNFKDVTIPQVWKFNGDEILLNDKIHSVEQVLAQTVSFYETIIEVDKKLSEFDLGVKGTIWTAGFPIRNKVIDIDIDGSNGEYPTIYQEMSDPDPDTGYMQSSPRICDYLGIEVDAGFRLTSFTSKGQVLVSLDVADFITRTNEPDIDLDIHHLGWRILSGSYNDEPYPIFWLSSDKIQRKSKPWDGFNDELRMNYINGDPLPSRNIQKLIKEYREVLEGLVIKPYIHPQDITPGHSIIWKEDPKFTGKMKLNGDQND